MKQLRGPIPFEARKSILALEPQRDPISLFELGCQSKLRYEGQPLVLGVGAIIEIDGYLNFALSRQSYWNQGAFQEVEIKLIGGAVEPGETFQHAALREIQEETGNTGLILDSSETFHFDSIRGAKGFLLTDSIRPMLIHEQQFEGLPRNPTAVGYWNLLGVIFHCAASPGSNLSPCAEVPGIVRIPVEQFGMLPTHFKFADLTNFGIEASLQAGVHIGDGDVLRVGASLGLLQKLGLRFENINPNSSLSG